LHRAPQWRLTLVILIGKIHMKPQHAPLAYRPEIDGLRAIAVVAVMLYHADIDINGRRLFSGGFLGVDIFFVISGYLISSIILTQLQDGRFTFANFYERRVRRIFPALFFVMFGSLPFAWTLLLPGALLEFTSSVAATSLFVSNIFFWAQDPYTSAPSLLKPLLHTWSLSVEEQFYILFPPFLIILHRWFSRYFVQIVSLLFLVSLMVAHWSSVKFPSLNFFFLHGRIWELLCGALLAWNSARGQGDGKMGHSAFACSGLVIIIGSIFLFTEELRHPSFWTVLPVFGTCLIIARPGQSSNLVLRLLTAPVIVGVGLISYSLYLWHQPVFAFARIYSVVPLSLAAKILLLCVCVGLSFMSWRWVEQPFRDSSRVGVRRIWMLGLFGAFCSLVVFLLTHIGNGFPGRFPDVVRNLYEPAESVGNLVQNGRPCHRRPVADACTFVSGDGSDKWFLLGDSNAARLARPLWNMLQNGNATFTLLTQNGCFYAPGMLLTRDGKVFCPLQVNLSRKDLLLNESPATIVIFGSLPVYMNGGFQAPNLPAVMLRESLEPFDESSRLAAIDKSIRTAVGDLLAYGHRIVLVYPIPEVEFDIRRRILQLLATHPSRLEAQDDRFGVYTSYADFREQSASSYRLFDSIPPHKRLIRVKPEDRLCNLLRDGECVVMDLQSYYYVDSYHLSHFGASLIVEQIQAATAGN
jgi:peptidoglycan/LPS O-acetylase OafA/YrhL